MPYSIIQDFRGGVDRRRPVHALPPGTLWDAINCHITRGGDVEKRKAFAPLGTFSSNTFGLLAKGEQLYTFGSFNPDHVTLPADVLYQQLQHPFGAPMTRLVSAELFGGSIYAIAEFSGGEIVHFYNGNIVADWNNGIARISQVSINNLATALASLIAASPNFTATATANVITVTAMNAGTPFTMLGTAVNGGVVNDQAIAIANVTPNTPAVTGVAATFSFQITAGDGTGTITSITVGGTEVFNSTIAWATSNVATAGAVAAQINTQTGSTGWTAASVGQTITLTKNVTGATHNNLTVAATWTNTLKINNTAAATAAVIGSTSGGITAVAAVAQVNTITITGTFDAGDGFGIRTVSGSTNQTIEYFGNYAKPIGAATWLKTHKRKLYVGTGAIVNFCAVNDATSWNQDVAPGAGFVNASTHVGGSELALAAQSYQNRLAIFSRRAIQLWDMENDDTLNALQQVLENTGTRAPRSTAEYGGNDVFYLDDTGIRSLRARDASNNAYLADVGVAIDRLVRSWMKSGVTEDQIQKSCCVVDPIDGRFWLAVGTRIYVYSYYPTSRVAAWTWYEPGFVVDWFARTKSDVYARSGNTLYLYGGTSGEQYDNCLVTVQLPFFSGNRPGTYKEFTGMDMTAVSSWSVRWFVNPSVTVNGSTLGGVGLTGPFVDLGQNEEVTYPGPNWNSGGHFTHIAARFTHQKAEYASLSEVAFYYEGEEESA